MKMRTKVPHSSTSGEFDAIKYFADRLKFLPKPKRQARARTYLRPPIGQSSDRSYFLTSVSNQKETTAEGIVRRFLDKGWYAFRDTTKALRRLSPGDHIAIYQAGVGVIAQVIVASLPERRRIHLIYDAAQFPWAFRVTDMRYFFDKPLVIDTALRSRLDAFKGHSPKKSWNWFVHSAHRITEHDFHILVGNA